MTVTLGTLAIEIKNSGMPEANNGLQGLARNSDAATAAVDKLSRATGTLSSAMHTAVRAFVTFEALKMGKEVSLLAARYETLGVTMHLAGRNAGLTGTQMDTLEAKLRQQGIAAVEARESLTKMAASHIDLAKASELARAAQDLAVVGGINSSEAFGRLVYGIQSAQVEVLRTIGLNVNFEESYKKLAKELGKTTEQLTQQQKLQARINVTLEQSKSYVGLYEAAMTTAGKQVTSLTRYWQDMQVELGNSQLPAVTNIVRSMTDRLKEFTAVVKDEDTQTRLARVGDSIFKIFDGATKVARVVTPLVGDVIEGWGSLPEPLRELGLIGAVAFGKRGMAAVAGISAAKKALDDYLKAAQVEQFTPDPNGQAKSQQLSDMPSWVNFFDLFGARERGQRGIAERQARTKSYPSEEQFDAMAAQGESDPETARRAGMAAARQRARDRMDELWIKANPYTPPSEAAGKAKGADKIKGAREAITYRLERFEDDGEGVGSRLAALTKEYNHFVEVLGKGDPQVKKFAEQMAYAKEHGGYTQDQVAKAEVQAKERIVSLEKEIAAIKDSTDADGDVDQTKLRTLNAIAQAEAKYHDSIRTGVPETTALREKELAVQKAQLEATQQNEEVQQQFLQTASSVLRNRADLQERLLDREMKLLRRNVNDSVLLAEYEAQKRLEMSRNASDGIIRSFQSWSDDATNMAKQFGDAFTNVLNGTTEVLAQFTLTGKLSVKDMVNSMLADMARLAARKATNSLFTGILGAATSALGGTMTKGWASLTNQAYDPALQQIVTKAPIHHAGGMIGTSGVLRTVPMDIFAGARRYHDGGPVLGPDEVAMIGLKGENVQSKAEVSAMAKFESGIMATLASMADAIGRMGGGMRVVNVLDQSLIHEAMASSGGEQVFLNFIRTNSGAVNTALGR